MRGPKPEPIVLPDAARTALEQLARRHTTPQQLALRARIVLAAAEGHNNAQIGRELDISLDMARLWRRRWLALQAASLDDLPVLDRLTRCATRGQARAHHRCAGLPNPGTGLRSTGALGPPDQPLE